MSHVGQDYGGSNRSTEKLRAVYCYVCTQVNLLKRKKGGRSRETDCAYSIDLWTTSALNGIFALPTQKVITSCRAAACRVIIAWALLVFTVLGLITRRSAIWLFV